MKCVKASVAAGSILCLVALSAGLSIASDNSTGEILKSTPEKFDAGTVAEGKNVEVMATVQNVGNTPVEITNVRTS